MKKLFSLALLSVLQFGLHASENSSVVQAHINAKKEGLNRTIALLSKNLETYSQPNDPDIFHASSRTHLKGGEKNDADVLQYDIRTQKLPNNAFQISISLTCPDRAIAKELLDSLKQ